MFFSPKNIKKRKFLFLSAGRMKNAHIATAMKRVFAIQLLSLFLFSCPSRAGNDSLLLMFWNLENFFDYRDGGAGREFSSGGERHWTAKRFYAKCEAVSKAVMWIAGKYGRLPDIIAVAEVENRFVTERLAASYSLKKAGYRTIHYDSPDPRGIDVAILYRKDSLELVRSAPCRTFPAGSEYGATRDILLASFRAGGSTFSVLVNHLPSKYGGTAVSAPRRRAAAERLRFLADSLIAAGCRAIIAAGDFNDTPDKSLFSVLSPVFVNKAFPLFRRGEGTIRFNGRWEMIDMFFVTPDLDGLSVMEAVRVPFLMTRDAMSGEKPLRTYSGPRYTGGVSDHLPVVLRIARTGR